MASEVVWSDFAIRDLNALHDHIAKESPNAATRYVEGLRDASRRLTDHPQSGRAFDSSYRVLVHRNHLVFHRYDADRDLVTVVRVVDARRDLGAGIDHLAF